MHRVTSESTRCYEPNCSLQMLPSHYLYFELKIFILYYNHVLDSFIAGVTATKTLQNLTKF